MSSGRELVDLLAYICQPELELKQLDIFAELELEKINLENPNLNSDLLK